MATVLSLPQDANLYSLRDWQSFVHYGSSRLSHCAKEIALVYYDSPDLCAICATQLERDVQSVMTIWSTASLLFPGQLAIPVTLQNLARVIVDRQIREKKVLLAAIRKDPSFFDSPVSSFIDAWWGNSPVIPWTMTLDELATAWRAQREAFDRGFSRYRPLELERRVGEMNRTFLREACAMTRECINQLNEQMEGSYESIEAMGAMLNRLDLLIEQ
ncbi:hypothetical protein BKA70DRAFT_1240376 [Coprinopsis sp. MPI-PUGE-AT-0042]|nr:hypothetical protein BKA70DRAFT_1240376 [Coprinopsis sp. MPI-PUGE-AT-0042]